MQKNKKINKYITINDKAVIDRDFGAIIFVHIEDCFSENRI